MFKKYTSYLFVLLLALRVTASAYSFPVNIPSFNIDTTITTSDVVESTDRLFVTAAEKAAIGTTGGGYTGPSIDSNLMVVEQGESIQVAMNATQGLIFINPGTFSETLNIPNNVYLLASGVGNTIIKQPNGVNGNVVSVPDSDNWSLANLTIDGNKANNPTGDNGLVITGASNFAVRNIESKNNKLKGVVTASDADNVQDGSFENVTTHDNDQDGGPVLASGTIASGFKTKRVNVTGTRAYSNGQYGFGAVTPDTTYSQVEDCTFDKNYAWSNGTYGIEFKGGNRLLISDNRMWLNGYHGMNLGLHTNTQFKVRNSIITRNIAWNNSKNYVAGYSGINRQAMEYSIVAENIVYDDQSPHTQRGLTDSGNNGSTNVVVNNIQYGNLP